MGITYDPRHTALLAMDCQSGVVSASAKSQEDSECYHSQMFNFGKPKTAGDWIAHLVLALIAIFLIWWLLRLFIV